MTICIGYCNRVCNRGALFIGLTAFPVSVPASIVIGIIVMTNQTFIFLSADYY